MPKSVSSMLRTWGCVLVVSALPFAGAVPAAQAAASSPSPSASARPTPPATSRAPAPSPSSASTSGPTVSVVHALRGVVADVLVDGQVVLEGFAPERATDPLPLRAGRHSVVVRRTGTSGTPLIEQSVRVEPGSSTSLVVYFDASGAARLTSFDNPDRRLPAGRGALSLRNTAAVPAVRTLVNGRPTGGAVEAGSSTEVPALPAGAHTVSVQSPQGELLYDGQTVDVPAGATTALYLIGSEDDDSLTWLVQTLAARSAPPSGVPTGDTGLKAAQGTGPATVVVTSAGAVLLAVLVLRRRVREA